MKRFFAILCIGILILSGCAPVEPAPDPVYDTAPDRVETGITVGGVPLENLYKGAETYYIEAESLLSVLGGTAQADLGIESHTLTVTAENWSRTYISGGETANALYDGTKWYLPYEELLTELGYHLFEDTAQNHRYYTVYPKADGLYGGAEVPILMYHAVSDDLWGISGLFVSPSEMEKQLKYIVDNGYTPIFFEDLANIETIEKPVILTFDDGYDDNYTNLFPLLKRYNVKATVFMITGSIGAEHYLTAEQISEMQASGLVSFQSHTASHPDLGSCTAEELDAEMLQSKSTLAQITGKEPFVLCYPMGKWSDLSLEKTAEYYEYGIFMSGKTYVTGQTDRVKIYRKYVSRTTSLDSFAGMLRVNK